MRWCVELFQAFLPGKRLPETPQIRMLPRLVHLACLDERRRLVDLGETVPHFLVIGDTLFD